MVAAPPPLSLRLGSEGLEVAAEARRLMQDDAYVKEAREVAELMEHLRGPR